MLHSLPAKHHILQFPSIPPVINWEPFLSIAKHVTRFLWPFNTASWVIGNLYLFKDNAELVEGFPIKGSSSFNLIDSDNDGKLEIISRLDKFSVVSYEIN